MAQDWLSRCVCMCTERLPHSYCSLTKLGEHTNGGTKIMYYYVGYDCTVLWPPMTQTHPRHSGPCDLWPLTALLVHVCVLRCCCDSWCERYTHSSLMGLLAHKLWSRTMVSLSTLSDGTCSLAEVKLKMLVAMLCKHQHLWGSMMVWAVSVHCGAGLFYRRKASICKSTHAPAFCYVRCWVRECTIRIVSLSWNSNNDEVNYSLSQPAWVHNTAYTVLCM